MVLKNSRRKKDVEREPKRERVLWGSSWPACRHLHTRCALPQLWNVFVRAFSLTTDPPNHYHRNLIQTIHSASFIVCGGSSLYYLASSIYFLSLLLSQNVSKPIFQIWFPQSSPFFNYWLLNVFTQNTLYKHRFTLIHKHSCWLHFNGNPWAVTRQ